MNSNKDSFPLIIFIPVIICVAAILFLLNLRQQQLHPLVTATFPRSTAENLPGQDRFEPTTNYEEQIETEDSEDDAAEGSSSAVRIRKVGKKRGKKLQRKEQMRQYREYMDQQREIRKAQDEVNEQEFQRRKLEESIKRSDELDKRRKEKEKKAKADEKEELKRQKIEEKEAKKRQARFNKYSERLKKLVKEKRQCEISEIAKSIGLSQEEVVDILNQLCSEDIEFELCLWPDTDTFLFITSDDYIEFQKRLKGKGKMSIHEASI